MQVKMWIRSLSNHVKLIFATSTSYIWDLLNIARKLPYKAHKYTWCDNYAHFLKLNKSRFKKCGAVLARRGRPEGRPEMRGTPEVRRRRRKTR